jgi:hypothetical protein
MIPRLRRDRSPETEEPSRPGVSRRAFLRSTTLTAAAVGVAGSVPGFSGLLAAGSADAPAIEAGGAEVEGDAAQLSVPVVAHIRDLSTGEMSVFQGEREVVIRDASLARRLAASAHK